MDIQTLRKAKELEEDITKLREYCNMIYNNQFVVKVTKDDNFYVNRNLSSQAFDVVKDPSIKT